MPAPAMSSWCQSPRVSRARLADVITSAQIAELRSPIAREVCLNVSPRSSRTASLSRTSRSATRP
eukprot:5925934-Alexandrium_andersonii.AAC.1